MRVYLSLFIATFRSTVAYKSAVFAGMFATVVSIGILVSLWSRVLVETGRGSIKDFDLPAVTTYFVCGNLFALLLQNEVDTRVAGEIYRGDHICALVRPIDYRRGHLVLGIAVIASRALVLALPLLLVAAVVLPMTSPRPGDLLLGLVSLILALAIALNANLLLGLVGFATSNTWGGALYLRQSADGSIRSSCTFVTVTVVDSAVVGMSSIRGHDFYAYASTSTSLCKPFPSTHYSECAAHLGGSS
jgi:ABC transporter permease protein acbX